MNAQEIKATLAEINRKKYELETALEENGGELTPELLRLFIQRIEIGERAKKYSHSAAQDIRIVYRDIGMVDSDMEKGEQPVHMATLPQNIDEVVKMLA